LHSRVAGRTLLVKRELLTSGQASKLLWTPHVTGGVPLSLPVVVATSMEDDMHKGIVALAVALVSGLALAADAPAPIPREGSTSGMAVFSGAVKMMAVGTDRAQFSYDVMGVMISDAGEGILHNASIRCMGGMQVASGAFDNESGSCVITRPDGDQIFQVIKGTGKTAAAAKGTYTYVGGTGKMAGITGGGEYTRTSVRPAAEGTSQSVSRTKGSYKLP